MGFALLGVPSRITMRIAGMLLMVEAAMVIIIQFAIMSWGWVLGVMIALGWVVAWMTVEEYRCWKEYSVFKIQVVGVALLLFVSAFVYFPLLGLQYRVIDYGQGDVVYLNTRWTSSFIVPFVHPTVEYSDDQSVRTTCQAKTLDGATITASVSAGLTLPFWGLPAAHRAAGNARNLTDKVESELCRRYAAAVVSYAVAELPSRLALAFQVGGKQQKGMNDLGVLYAGPLNIQRFEVLVNQ